MADATEVEEEKGTASSKRRLIMIAGGAVAVVAGLGGAYFFMGDSLLSSSSNASIDPVAEEQAKQVVFYDLPEMVVNLSTDGRRTYLKVLISLELSDQKMVSKVEPFLPRILDAFQIYLRELRPADLEGSSGLFRLKEQLLRRINLAVYPARIEGVLFKEILIQ